MKVIKTDKQIIVKPTENKEVLSIEEIYHSEEFFSNDLSIHENDHDTLYLYNANNGKIYYCTDYYYTYRDNTWLGTIKDNLENGEVTTFYECDLETEKELLETYG